VELPPSQKPFSQVEYFVVLLELLEGLVGIGDEAFDAVDPAIWRLSRA
jgi:hypothetical protein